MVWWSSQFEAVICTLISLLDFLFFVYLNYALFEAHLGSRWQVDLIDLRTHPDGNFNWIMNVQDHFTKFLWLRPLTHKTGIDCRWDDD